VLCLAVAAAGVAVVISRDERPPAECLGSSANHVLYVTGFPRWVQVQMPVMWPLLGGIVAPEGS
jgi:hypothetical protein